MAAVVIQKRAPGPVCPGLRAAGGNAPCGMVPRAAGLSHPQPEGAMRSGSVSVSSLVTAPAGLPSGRGLFGAGRA
jgi:hypothetical protein